MGVTSGSGAGMADLLEQSDTLPDLHSRPVVSSSGVTFHGFPNAEADRSHPHFSYSDSLIYEVFTRQLRRIPPFVLPVFLKNFGSTVSALSESGPLTSCVSGCSGTDVYAIGNQVFSTAVHDLFDVEVPAWEQTLASDNDESRLSFVRRQHPGLRILCGDIAQLEGTQVWNLLRGQWEPVPFSDFYVGGFSCKDLSSQNSQRAAL